MSEPKAVAARLDEVVPGVRHWSVHDERIDFVSDSYAVDSDDGAILIDPLPLTQEALRSLAQVAAICLTAGIHQRSAWRYRRELGVPVYAPALVREVEEEPDVRYREGDQLPAGLQAVFTPGAGTTQHTLLRGGDPPVAFCSDLLLRPPGGNVAVTPDEFVHDPEETRRSVEKLLELPFALLCLSHGGPVHDDPKAAIRRALAA